MNKTEQLQTIAKICTSGKGILAADESSGTIGKRFNSIQLTNTHENRYAYRNMLFTTPSLNKHISGVITFEETLLDVGPDGQRLIQPLLDADIVVGIKVDKGVKSLYGTHDETVTQGMDDLDVRCKQYYDAGARFAKWRAVLKVDMDKNLPSELSIHENAVTLARYASISQNNGLVPIVEPEILMDGTHSMEQSHEVAVNVLSQVYRELVRHHVDIECTLLKPNMIRPGVSSGEALDCVRLGELTVNALQQAVPVSMPGVVFLSGGMSEIEASIALNEINKVEGLRPWYLTFSYGRALQSSVMEIWKGDEANVDAAQNMLLHRANANGLAAIGEYVDEENTGKSLHETNYVY
jgi:fructose-bisphosphate aldolase class I|tara:strand:+ start:17441 stop:18496 length:1056 start_codon:yes stop_codon:yes gene_type:complete